MIWNMFIFFNQPTIYIFKPSYMIHDYGLVTSNMALTAWPMEVQLPQQGHGIKRNSARGQAAAGMLSGT